MKHPMPGAAGAQTSINRMEMTAAARKLRDCYARIPGAPLFQREFGFYCLERWKAQGMPQDVPPAELFGFDPPGNHTLGQLGWCEAAFAPKFEEKILEQRGELEVVQDFAGRQVLCFAGRRQGFMPEYLDHPVKDWRTWERDVQWRLAPETPQRYANLAQRMTKAQACAARGLMISQNLAGGYMYLRSLIGPGEVLYMFHDQPALMHACMQTWLKLADAIIARHQQYVTIDELFLAEDICFNNGPLISPAMIQEFLCPYYRQLIANLQRRQLDQTRHLYIQIDTDGRAAPVIPLYQQLGMDVMSPFEVAAGCDVVALGRQHPDLALLGGIDKRVLAGNQGELDRELDRILPAMRRRGGYIPTCDHGVPEEVPYANYCRFRKRCLELGG